MTCIVLLLGMYSGARRGLVLQLVHLIGYAISFAMAWQNYQWIAQKIELLVPYPSFVPGVHQFAAFTEEQAMGLEFAFYKLISFVGILMIGTLLTRIIGYMLSELTYLPIIKQFNGLGGALLGLLFNYIGLFFVFSMLIMIPMKPIQHLFEQPSMARGIVTYTPILAQHLTQKWIEEGDEQKVESVSPSEGGTNE